MAVIIDAMIESSCQQLFSTSFFRGTVIKKVFTIELLRNLLTFLDENEAERTIRNCYPNFNGAAYPGAVTFRWDFSRGLHPDCSGTVIQFIQTQTQDGNGDRLGDSPGDGDLFVMKLIGILFDICDWCAEGTHEKWDHR